MNRIESAFVPAVAGSFSLTPIDVSREGSPLSLCGSYVARFALWFALDGTETSTVQHLCLIFCHFRPRG